MITLVSGLSRLVRRFPAWVVAGVIVLTTVLAALSTQVQLAAGMEGFAPDNEHLEAAETLGERFATAAGEEVLQVVIDAGPGGDLISADGVRSVDAIVTALVESDAGERLTAGAQPPVLDPFVATREILRERGHELHAVNDADVRAAFLESVAADEETGAPASALLADDSDLAAPSSDAALLLAFISPEGLPSEGTARLDAMAEIMVTLVDAAEEAELAPGFSVSAFGFPLLFSDFDTFEAELQRLFASAFVIILLILGTVYWLRPQVGLRPLGAARRTGADVLLTMGTIVMAITWMNGVAVLLGPDWLDVVGPLTEMTQIIPVLLIGLGVDYAIHLTSRYREEIGRGATVEEAIARGMRTVGLALGLATVTTAVGFLTNVFNPVPTLRDFGIIAAVGIVAAFVLMLTFVPAARLLLDRRAARAGRLPGQALQATERRLLPATMARSAVLAERAPIATLVVTVALGGALGGWGLSQLETRFSQTEFVVPDHPMLVALETIEERFGGGFGETTEVLIAGDATRPELHEALVEATEALAEIEWVAQANGRPAAESPVSLLAGLLAPGPDGAPLAPSVAELAAAEGIGEDLRFREGGDVTAVYDAALTHAPDEAARVLEGPAGAATHARVGIQTTSSEEEAAELLAALERAFAPVVAAGGAVTITSNSIINESIITALQEAQLASLTITLGVVLLVLVLSFWLRNRRPALGVITTVPVVLALLWTFAMMAATGIPFSPVTSMIAALAIGIGIPYSIHVTNRFEEDRHRLPTAEAIRSTVRHTGGALAGSALTTCAGFGILLTSSLTPFRQFGAVTVFAIGFALLAATLVLPSALTLWDRWHRVRTRPENRRHEPEGRRPASVPLP